jgi:DNA polymerase I-like protein with 3'-5' exonuclease and polymerase domains
VTTIAVWDSETNGLLTAKREKDGSLHPPMDRVHTVTLILWDTTANTYRYISAADQPGYEEGKRHWNVQTPDGPEAVMLEPGEEAPAGQIVWERMSLVAALRLIEQADMRVAHNGDDFDERAIPLVYPWFAPKPGSYSRDTLIMSRCIYPDIHRTGPNSHKVYGFLKNAHSLKAWGMRLGEAKGDYKGGWMHWSEGMQRYGEQDTVVLLKLFKWLIAQKPAPEMLELEHAFAKVIRRQESRGVAFDHDKALLLLGELQEVKTNLEAALIETFGEWWAFGKAANSSAQSIAESEAKEQRRHNGGPALDDEVDENDLEEMANLEDDEVQAERYRQWQHAQGGTADVMIPTKTREVKMVGVPDITRPRYGKNGNRLADYVGPPKMIYTQGAAYTPIKRIQFNPGSRTQIIKRLKAQFGWEPSKFTVKKNPIVDDSILRALPWPEAQKLADYFLVNKRLGQLAVGKKAWLKVCVETQLPNGQLMYRIHGRVNTNGAGTGRCTHSDPNLAQVPKNTAEAKNSIECVKGYRYRELFYAAKPYDLWGFDGAALELRMLAHYVAKWDHGEYARIVHEGKKEDRTDPHSWLCLLIGEDLLGPVSGQGRDHAKTVMYADLYGAGDEKRGAIVIPQASKEEKQALGRKIKDKMESRFLAKKDLQRALETSVEDKGSITGLDKRKLYVRKAHAALNTLLQSAGAVTMKMALVILDDALQARGLKPGEDYEFVLNIHDEAQAEVLPQHGPLYKELAEAAMVEAGVRLRLKCPLRAEASSGHTWAQTH